VSRQNWLHSFTIVVHFFLSLLISAAKKNTNFVCHGDLGKQDPTIVMNEHVLFSCLTLCSSSFSSCSPIESPPTDANFKQLRLSSPGKRNSKMSFGGRPRVLLSREEDGITSSNTEPLKHSSWNKLRVEYRIPRKRWITLPR
jgi:hypothetical protein